MGDTANVELISVRMLLYSHFSVLFCVFCNSVHHLTIKLLNVTVILLSKFVVYRFFYPSYSLLLQNLLGICGAV